MESIEWAFLGKYICYIFDGVFDFYKFLSEIPHYFILIFLLVSATHQHESAIGIHMSPPS